MEGEKAAELLRLEESVQENPDDSSFQFDLGLFLWENSKEDNKAATSFKLQAAEHFLASARLDPQNGVVFRYLGHYYGEHSLDPNRAIKCYQRALSLNPDDSLSGEPLCDLLDRLGKESLEAAVCRDASQRSPRAFWAFRRLGYLQVHQRKWSEAVQSLQHAIRGYPASADLWEALGLAYNRLGRFVAAIKSYRKAIELEPKKVFALVECGNVFLMFGSFKKGIELFRHALEISPDCLSANYGLASGLLGKTKECICLGALRWGATLLEEASKLAEKLTRLAANLSSIWKLHGDIQLTYAKCYPWMEEIHKNISVEAFNASINSWKHVCCLAATSARRSYQRALLLNPWEANIYTDIAISSDIVNTFTKCSDFDINAWQPPEKMALGSLLFEPENNEFWLALGCLSNCNPLKQHSLIRVLQIDASQATAWSYLGKIYRGMDEKQLARLAFDCSRSIDPSLALPWAGLSADFHATKNALDEAFECCLRAVQTLPIAEFQMGLAKLAVGSGHLSSPQAYSAIKQAVQRAPHCPESHNLKGLFCEARSEYQTAATSYKLALCALTNLSAEFSNSQMRDISINLARSLFKAGNAHEAVEECKKLKRAKLLDEEGLQIYALSLWKLGQRHPALSVVKNLSANVLNVSTKKHTSVIAPVSLICRLLYSISGLESAVKFVLKMPKVLFQCSKINVIVSAIHALDEKNRLKSVVSSSCNYGKSHEDITEMHFLISLCELLKNGSGQSIGLQSGVAHLSKAVHMYPNSCLLRNLLSFLLLFDEECNDTHLAIRCCKWNAYCSPVNGLKSAYEIIGAAAVGSSNNNPDSSFPICPNQCLDELGPIQQLQKCLRQEPWNRGVRYLLILNLLQKARKERFPPKLCTMLERLISVALSDQCYSETLVTYRYERFQILLCASEISLQSGNQNGCIKYAKVASTIAIPDKYLFFAHLLLCRAYASAGDLGNLKNEYLRCLKLETDSDIGWSCLKMIKSHLR